MSSFTVYRVIRADSDGEVFIRCVPITTVEADTEAEAISTAQEAFPDEEELLVREEKAS